MLGLEEWAAQVVSHFDNACIKGGGEGGGGGVEEVQLILEGLHG